jgi:hypothetical protein
MTSFIIGSVHSVQAAEIGLMSDDISRSLDNIFKIGCRDKGVQLSGIVDRFFPART